MKSYSIKFEKKKIGIVSDCVLELETDFDHLMTLKPWSNSLSSRLSFASSAMVASSVMRFTSD